MNSKKQKEETTPERPGKGCIQPPEEENSLPSLAFDKKLTPLSEEEINSRCSNNGLAAFLAGPYIKGVGQVYAGKLADEFGPELLNPDFDFQRIPEKIPGIGEIKTEELRKSLSAMKIRPEIAVVLYSAGLSDVEVEKIISHYGKKTGTVVLNDPYDMVENAWKVSFFTADKLGRWLGIESDDPRRLRGALLTSVKFYAERGHIFATEEQAITTAANFSGVGAEPVAAELENLIKEERLIRSREGIYLPVYYHAEKEAAQKLAGLIRQSRNLGNLYDLPTHDISGNPLNEDQKKALQTVMTNAVTVITGGPGTGKTTTVRGIISLFESMDKKVILAAPTGRAAKRMSDLAGAEAKTIHRLLGYNQGKGYRHKHFDGDILVIDESSMLEQVLFNHLLEALNGGTRVVLVGDTNQLPPIGAGDVLNDLILSGTVPVITLKENFRQKAGSMIASAAEAIKTGAETPEGENKDFIRINEDSPEKIHERIISLVGEELPSKYGIDARDIQVVTPQNDGPLGAKQLNIDLQERVNPGSPEIKRGMKRFRLGDRVMQTSNSSEHNVYNGETGWISDIDTEKGELEVTFHDGKKLKYPKERLKELNLAYAMTVHKLQGSETDYMVMLLTSAHRQMLYRNLLYTGISRAKKLCVLVGEPKAIDTAIANASPTVRNSNFKHRLRSLVNG